MAELSYRSGITESGGALSPEWKAMFASHSNRFLLGSDTWIPERWSSYDAIMKNYRAWLVQLPPEQAKRIAHGNAERLYGGKVE
jgi:predicted TIM-barrel fold metal-dependent hydrolase